MRFDFSNDYVLENDRARLEPLTSEHINLLAKVASEKELWTYFLGKSDGGGNFKEYIERAIQGRTKKREYAFAVYNKLKGEYAGSTRFFDFESDLNTVRLGYSWYGQRHRGTGLNKNCKFLLFEFAFEKMNFERIGLGAHEENLRSIAAMEGVGCKHEGVIRNLFPAIHRKGRAHAILLGILKDEWYLNVRNNLNQQL